MKIGELAYVDIREFWSGKATDFTPWLANIWRRWTSF